MQYSVRDFVNAAATKLGILLTWQGNGLDAKAYDDAGQCIVSVDPIYFRPAEVETLLGDASKARERLGWRTKTTFADLVREMVREDLRLAECADLASRHGYNGIISDG